MNVEKLKRLQAQVRIGGKGTLRRKKKVIHQTAATDDKKLQSSLKKLSVSTIPGIEEVNIIKNDLSVIHFNNPKAQASLSANTFAVTGHGENKKIVEMLPEILPQLGQETVVQLRCFANCLSNNQKGLSSVAEEDDVPTLVSDFDEASKHEVGTSMNNVEKIINESAIKEQKNKGGENLNIKKEPEIIGASNVSFSGETPKQQLETSSNKGKTANASSKNKDKLTNADAKENKKSKKHDKPSNKSAVRKAGEELISATTQLLAEIMPTGTETNASTKSKGKKSVKNQELSPSNNTKNSKPTTTEIVPIAMPVKESFDNVEKPAEQKISPENESKPQQDAKIDKSPKTLKNVLTTPPETTGTTVSQTAKDVKKIDQFDNIVEQTKLIQPIVMENPDLEKISKIEVSKHGEPLKQSEQTGPEISKSSDVIKLAESIEPVKSLTISKDENLKQDEKLSEASDKNTEKPIEKEKSKEMTTQQSKEIKTQGEQSSPIALKLSDVVKLTELPKKLDGSEMPPETTKSQESQEIKPLGLPTQVLKDLPGKKEEDKSSGQADKMKESPKMAAALPTEVASFSDAAKLNINLKKSELSHEPSKVPTTVEPEQKKNDDAQDAIKPSETVQIKTKDVEIIKSTINVPATPSVISKSAETDQQNQKTKSSELVEKSKKLTEVTPAAVKLKETPTPTIKPNNDEKPKANPIKSNKSVPPVKATEAKEPKTTDKGKITEGIATANNNITPKSPKKPTETKKTAPMKQEAASKSLEGKSSPDAKKQEQMNKPKQPSPKPQPKSPNAPATAATVNTASVPLSPAKQSEKSQTVQHKSQQKPSSTSKPSTANKAQQQQQTGAKAKQMSPPKLPDAATPSSKKIESTIDNKIIQKDAEMKPPSATGGKQSSPKPRGAGKQQQHPKTPDKATQDNSGLQQPKKSP